MMQLGAEGNFVGSGIFKSSDPERRAKAIVEATTHFNDPERVAAASVGLGEAMPGLEISELEASDALLQHRGSLTCGSAFSRSRAASKPTSHAARRWGRRSLEVRTPADLDGLDGLVIPGGESTTIRRASTRPAWSRRFERTTKLAGRSSGPARG